MVVRELGVGVISLGWMGRLHTRAYKEIRERYPELGVRPRLIAAADPVEGFREEATDVLGFERSYPDYRELLADPEVEVVSIAAPNYLHREMAVAAAEAGKPFWIEKPMGVDAAQARDIAEAAARAGVVTSVGFNYRNAPAVQHARDLIRSGALGRITNVRCSLLADYASDESGPLTWRYSRELAGSGVFSDLMSHGYDLAQYLVGPIAAITAMSGTFITERPIPLEAGIGHASVRVSDETGPVGNEDYGAALARFDNGVLGTFETSRVARGPRAEYRIEVYGTAGSVRWNFEHPEHLQVRIDDAENAQHRGYVSVMNQAGYGDFARFQPASGHAMGFDDLKTVEAKLFLESVLTGRQLAPSAADAWSAAACDEATVASAADGLWHEVPRIAGTTVDS